MVISIFILPKKYTHEQQQKNIYIYKILSIYVCMYLFVYIITINKIIKSWKIGRKRGMT